MNSSNAVGFALCVSDVRFQPQTFHLDLFSFLWNFLCYALLVLRSPARRDEGRMPSALCHLLSFWWSWRGFEPLPVAETTVLPITPQPHNLTVKSVNLTPWSFSLSPPPYPVHPFPEAGVIARKQEVESDLKIKSAMTGKGKLTQKWSQIVNYVPKVFSLLSSVMFSNYNTALQQHCSTSVTLHSSPYSLYP